MHLAVNFIYDASVKHRRKVNATDVRYVGQVPVEVREADPAEAPVAMRLTAPRNYDRAPGHRVELRWFVDGLFIPVYEVTTRDHPAPALCEPRGADWLRAIAADGHRRTDNVDVPLAVGVSWERYGVPRPASEDPLLREVVTSKEAEVAARIVGQARDLVLVGGVLHRRCPEPFYQVHHMGRWRDEPGYAYIEAHLGAGERRDLANQFRADELDWLVENRPYVRTEPERRIEVLIPEAVRDRIPHHLYVAEARSLYEWLRGRVADGDRPFFDAYADLREALAAHDAEADPAKADPAGADAAFARLAEVVDRTLARVESIPNDRRQALETPRARLEALGYWHALDAGAFAP